MKTKLTRIIISPDYGDAYAWDQGGSNIGLAGYFPKNKAVRQVEKEFVKWAIDFRASMDEDFPFQWKSFNERGLALTQQLNEAIPPEIDITISYCKCVSDPTPDEPGNDGRSFRKRKATN